MSTGRGTPLESNPTRVVMAGDWHGDTGHARSVIEWAKRQGADGIVHLGDFGVWPGQSGQRYLQQVQAPLNAAGLWLAFIDGNHDDHWQLRDRDNGLPGPVQMRWNIWHLKRGLRWAWHGRTWLALGGATSLDRPSRRPGVSWWPEEEITAGQVIAVAQGGPVDVMLTHDCPAGIDIPGLPPASAWPAEELVRANAHRRVLRSVVDEVVPARLWHGHFHVRHDAVLHGAGYMTAVTGLNDNTGPWHENVQLIDVATLTEVG